MRLRRVINHASHVLCTRHGRPLYDPSPSRCNDAPLTSGRSETTARRINTRVKRARGTPHRCRRTSFSYASLCYPVRGVLRVTAIRFPVYNNWIHELRVFVKRITIYLFVCFYNFLSKRFLGCFGFFEWRPIVRNITRTTVFIGNHDFQTFVDGQVWVAVNTSYQLMIFKIKTDRKYKPNLNTPDYVFILLLICLFVLWIL